MCNTDHPRAVGVTHGEAAPSHNEVLHHAHGTPDPQAMAHHEADRKSIGHKARAVGGAKGNFFGKR